MAATACAQPDWRLKFPRRSGAAERTWKYKGVRFAPDVSSEMLSQDRHDDSRDTDDTAAIAK